MKRRGIDREEALLQRKLRAETITKANDKLYEQTGKMKLLRSNLLYAEVIEASDNRAFTMAMVVLVVLLLRSC